MTALTLDAGAVAALLAERAEALATEVVGAPPTSRSRDQVRFFEKGGLVVEITGPRRGIGCSFGDGQVGGDALDLVRHFRRCSLAWRSCGLRHGWHRRRGGPPGITARASINPGR